MLIESSNNDKQSGFTATERILFNRLFEEKLNATIPALLLDIWDSKYIKVHPLPDMQGDCIVQLYRYNPDSAVTTLTVDEYADYLNLPEDTPLKIIETVETLAEGAGKSYAWNVRNAFIKGGRVRGAGSNLHVTDWQSEFRFNIVKNQEAWEGIHSTDVKGWAAYRYRFVAAKI
jgi:hypothetical protein